MSSLETFYVLAGVASVIAIPLGIFLARRHAQREKLLAYDVGMGLAPLVSARSLETYSLSVVYQAPDGPEERIPSAYVHFVRFANFGREPIRREDIAPENRLRIEVRGARVLDFALEAVRRSVSNINIEPQAASEDESHAAHVDFDFLDYQDGAVVRILTTAKPSELALVGDIIGQPTGVRSSQQVRKRRGPTWVGAFLAWATIVAALALTPIIYHWVTGSWADVWLLALPFLALLLSIVVIGLVAVTVWPKSELQFPRELFPRFRGVPSPMYMRHGYHAGPMEFESFEVIGADDDESEDQRGGETQTG